jgi:probable rRNA maturation factor
VVNRQRRVRIALRPLQKFLAALLQELHLAETELVICFVTDLEMSRMNEQFRNKLGPTDVLSFPAKTRKNRRRSASHASALPGRTAKTGTKDKPLQNHAAAEYLGDIAIAPAVARRNAKKYGRGLPAELRILILHGVLHLLGYDHETDHGEMHRREMQLRRRLGLSWAI